MIQILSNLNINKGERVVFAKVIYSTKAIGKHGSYPFQTGTYVGEIDEISLLENTAAAIQSEIERRRADAAGRV
jgi:hypothetical protein